MCGRYASSRKPEDLVGLFQVQQWDPTETVAPSWNTAPTDPVYAVLERAVKTEGPEPVRQLRTPRWGLVPSWSKSPDVGVKMINAKAETIQEKASFRKPFAARRCLIPADGYYEWLTLERDAAAPKAKLRKQPYFITPADGSVMAMAGLYEFWRDKQVPAEDPASWWFTCTVITTAAEPELARIHDRMPLVLGPERWDAWLDPSLTDPDEVSALLTPPAPGLMELRPVSAAVGNVRNNGPELVQRAEPEEKETLF